MNKQKYYQHIILTVKIDDSVDSCCLKAKVSCFPKCSLESKFIQKSIQSKIEAKS